MRPSTTPTRSPVCAAATRRPGPDLVSLAGWGPERRAADKKVRWPRGTPTVGGRGCEAERSLGSGIDRALALRRARPAAGSGAFRSRASNPQQGSDWAHPSSLVTSTVKGGRLDVAPLLAKFILPLASALARHCPHLLRKGWVGETPAAGRHVPKRQVDRSVPLALRPGSARLHPRPART